MNKDELRRARLAGLKKAETEGKVADSPEVRMALIERLKRGEITFDQLQTELRTIKRNAKNNGQVTRRKAYLHGGFE